MSFCGRFLATVVTRDSKANEQSGRWDMWDGWGASLWQFAPQQSLCHVLPWLPPEARAVAWLPSPSWRWPLRRGLCGQGRQNLQSQAPLRRVLNSILISIQTWVSNFQSRNPNLANTPLQMALNAHFMRQDSNSQKCVYVCVLAFFKLLTKHNKTFARSWFPDAYIMQDFCPGFLCIYRGYTCQFQHLGCLVMWCMPFSFREVAGHHLENGPEPAGRGPFRRSACTSKGGGVSRCHPAAWQLGRAHTPGPAPGLLRRRCRVMRRLLQAVCWLGCWVAACVLFRLLRECLSCCRLSNV